MFGQLGARGVSVLFASGDTGAGSGCLSNDGRNKVKLTPMFPASCPFVAAVGSTEGTRPETGSYFSSGGFSEAFSRPSYQDKAVERYLGQVGDANGGRFNRNGRAMPDVAAQGVGFVVVDRGQYTLINGTSASSPVFAGVISLINAQRIQSGRPPMGWLNPWIYGEGSQGLNDVTTGLSKGCDGTDVYSGFATPRIFNAGWPVTTGWDAVTGWGTPDYEKLLASAMKM